MKTKTFLKTILVASALIGPFSYASASQLWVDDASGNIFTVDSSTGASTLKGNAGVVLTDIAFAPNGSLYGVSFSNLYSINKNTGAATNIGSLGFNDVNALTFSSAGKLYGAGNGSGTFYEINTGTGAAAALFNTGTSSGGDLAFLGNSLYYTNSTGSLFSINVGAGSTTPIGSLGVANVFGLAADNGILFGTAGRNIYAINTTTGAAGSPLSTYTSSLAIANGATAAPVPLPAAIWLFGSALVGLIGFNRRNSMQQAA